MGSHIAPTEGCPSWRTQKIWVNVIKNTFGVMNNEFEAKSFMFSKHIIFTKDKHSKLLPKTPFLHNTLISYSLQLIVTCLILIRSLGLGSTPILSTTTRINILCPSFYKQILTWPIWLLSPLFFYKVFLNQSIFTSSQLRFSLSYSKVSQKFL